MNTNDWIALVFVIGWLVYGFSPVWRSWLHRHCGWSAPCKGCRYLRREPAAAYGIRCGKGDTGDQCGDFSCFRPR